MNNSQSTQDGAQQRFDASPTSQQRYGAPPTSQQNGQYNPSSNSKCHCH